MPKTQGSSGEILLLTSEQQVYAYELSYPFRVALGRHESNDLRLSSRTVSNYHAEILNELDGLLLRDLGSTNGTFVNNERIKDRQLKSEDRIRIGNHVLAVHFKPADGHEEGFFRFRRDPNAFGVGARGNIISLRAGSNDALKTLQARDPHDLSLPDLIKILTTNVQSVMVHIERGEEQGRVFVHKDRIVHAEYGVARGEKALYRLFGWQRARYEIRAWPESPAVPRTMDLPTDTLIYEGMKHVGELGKLVTQLPPLEAPLRLKEDCPLPLTAHTPAEVDIYQSIIRHETIARVLEESPLTDLRVLKLIQALLRKGVFEVAEKSSYSLEDTFVFRVGEIEPT